MLTKTKIALATALFAATSTAALAQGFDPNLANRYPAYASPVASAAQVVRPQASLQSAPVRLQRRDAGLSNPSGISTGQSEFNVDRTDHASSPYAGGGF